MSDNKKLDADHPGVPQSNRMQPPGVYLTPIKPCPGCGNPGGRMCHVPGTHCGY